jgi:uncharacterized protein (UPF0332 family)
MSPPALFSWKQFIEIAQFLVENANRSTVPQEAAYRCAVSRAYYGAFCHMLEYAEIYLGYNPSETGEDHDNLRKYLKDHDDVNIVKVARKLGRLRQWRNDSDYKIQTYNDRNRAESAISIANEIVTLRLF